MKQNTSCVTHTSMQSNHDSDCTLSPTKQSRNMEFTGGKPPITLRDYVERILYYSVFSPAVPSIAALYLSRALLSPDGPSFTILTAHRLVLAAFVLACKFHDDEQGQDMAQFAAIGGVKTSELCRIEIGLLDLLNWRLAVTADELQQLETQLLHPSPCTVLQLESGASSEVELEPARKRAYTDTETAEEAVGSPCSVPSDSLPAGSPASTTTISKDRVARKSLCPMNHSPTLRCPACCDVVGNLRPVVVERSGLFPGPMISKQADHASGGMCMRIAAPATENAHFRISTA